MRVVAHAFAAQPAHPLLPDAKRGPRSSVLVEVSERHSFLHACDIRRSPSSNPSTATRHAMRVLLDARPGVDPRIRRRERGGQGLYLHRKNCDCIICCERGFDLPGRAISWEGCLRTQPSCTERQGCAVTPYSLSRPPPACSVKGTPWRIMSTRIASSTYCPS